MQSLIASSRALAALRPIDLTAADAQRRTDDFRGFDRGGELARAVGSDLNMRSAADSGPTLLLDNLLPGRRLELVSAGCTASNTPDAPAAGITKLRAWWSSVG